MNTGAEYARHVAPLPLFRRRQYRSSWKERFFYRRHLYTERKRRWPEACRVLEERVNGEPSLGELRGKWLAWQPCCSVISAFGRQGGLVFWVGEKGIWGEEEKEEKQCEAQVISVCLVRCEGWRLGISLLKSVGVGLRDARSESACFHGGVCGAVFFQCLRAFGLPMHTRLFPSPRSGGLPDGG